MPTFIHNPTGLRFAVPPKNGFTLFESSKKANGDWLFSQDSDHHFPMLCDFDAMLVRDPVERFISAFRNKVRYKTWNEWCTKWVCSLTGVSLSQAQYIRIGDLLPKIEKLIKRGRSYSGWDFHFLPQVWQGELERIEQLYDIRHDRDLLDFLGVDYSRKENRTDHLSLEVTNEEKEWIATLYSMDGEFYERYRQFRKKRKKEGFVIKQILFSSESPK